MSSVGIEGSGAANRSSNGRSIRILGLPISLTRAKVLAQIHEKLRDRGLSVDRPGGIKFIRTKRGEVQVHVKDGSPSIKRCLAKWALDFGARVKWWDKNRKPSGASTQPTTPYKRFRVGTWNINGLRGKRSQVVEAILNMRLTVVALQETLITDADWPINISGFQVFTREYDASIPGARGLALGVGKHYNSYLAKSNPHWLYVKVLGVETGVTWHIINAYIPHDTLQRRESRKSLKSLVKSILERDDEARVLVLGDLNCNVNRAETLFHASTGMRLVSIRGSKKTYHKRRKWSALDHCLASSGAMPCLGKAKVRRDVDESDHFPVVVRVKQVNQSNQQEGITAEVHRRLNYGKLLECRDSILSDTVWETWLTELEHEKNVVFERDSKAWLNWAAEKWEKYSWQLMNKYEVLVKTLPPRKKSLKISVKKIIDRKREAWATYLQAGLENNSQEYKDYRAARKLAKKALMVQSSEDWVKFIQKGSESFMVGDTRKFFKWVDKVTKYRGRQTVQLKPIVDDNGVMQYAKEEILELWASHFERLFKGGEHATRDMTYWEAVGGMEQLETLPEMDRRLSGEDLQLSIQRLKRHKAAGNSGLTAEWYKVLEDKVKETKTLLVPLTPMQRIFFYLASAIWDNSYVPDRWAIDTLVTIGKSGDLSKRDNYRGIALIELFVKIVTAVATKRITAGLESTGRLCKEQAGFRSKEECLGQVLTLIEAVRRRKVEGLGTIIVFIDFKKAYDVVPKSALLYKLRKAGVDGKTLKFLEALNMRSRTQVKVGNYKSRVIELLRGCRQGCTASPTCFDVYIDDLAKQLREVGVTVPSMEELLASLLFADDLVLTVESVQQLKEACNIVTAWGDKWEMSVGIAKCGWMVVYDDGLKVQVEQAIQQGQVMLQNQPVPHVEEYVYLGIKLAEEEFLDLQVHMEDRIKKFEARWKRLEPFFRTHSIPIRARKHVFMVVCMPVLRWGCELLGPGEKDIRKMETSYSAALKCLVGSRSKNTIYAAETIRRELELPSFHQMVLRGRLRAWKKFPTLKTWVANVSELRELGRTHSWFVRTKNWLGKYPRLDATEGDALIKLREYCLAKEDRSKNITISLRGYLASSYAGTAFYLRHSGADVSLARGAVWLFRARVGAVWTAKRAAKMNLIEGEWEFKCPACSQVLGDARRTPNEISHILLDCPEYDHERGILDPLTTLFNGDVDPNIKSVFLLGGRLVGYNPPWSDAQWSGQDGETLVGTQRQAYKFVAEYLQKVMPCHMGTLWEHRLETAD
ncbi:hypothetical protein ACEPAG_1826 [Sanghuangporus baumii]